MSMNNVILIVDDEEKIRKLVRKYIEHEGYIAKEATCGQEAIDICLNEQVDLVIMDVMMPDIDGFKAYQKIREHKEIPCIFLTALNEEYNRIYGFDLGADDYVSKPFSTNELMKRVNVVLKRNHINKSNVIEVGGLKVDEDSRIVTVDGETLTLSLKEYELLVYLLKNQGIALSRENIIEKVWGYDYFKDDRTLDTHIKLLRKALKGYAKYITTIRGVGYRFEKDL